MTRTILFWSLLCAFTGVSSLYAGSCATAVPAPNTGTFYYGAFTNGCSLDPNGTRGCVSDVWFVHEPNLTGLHLNELAVLVRFPSAANLNWHVSVYESLSANSGSACDWQNGNVWHAPLHLLVEQTLTTGTTAFDLFPKNLDGQGTYFIVIENLGGYMPPGRTPWIELQHRIGRGTAPYCTPPTNDFCINATPMVLNKGVDPSVMQGNATSATPNWTYGVYGTTQCATASKFSNNTVPSSSITNSGTEDAKLDNAGGYVSTGPNACNSWIDNSVWYRFNRPAGTNRRDWYLHVSLLGCRLGSGIKVTVLRDVDCRNGAEARIAKSGFLGLPPYSCETVRTTNAQGNSVTIGPIDLDNSTAETYHVLVDGESRSLCDFGLLWVRNDNQAVLPVELAYFDGQVQDDQHRLFWEAQVENNVVAYAVERSFDAGQSFRELTQMPALGTDLGPRPYQFVTDATPGRAWYRLQIIDVDGEVSYSETVELTTPTSGSTLELLEVYPQPVQNFLNVNVFVAEAGTLQLECLDLSGRRVLAVSRATTVGSNQVELQTADLAPGMYVLRGRQNDQEFSVKLVKR